MAVRLDTLVIDYEANFAQFDAANQEAINRARSVAQQIDEIGKHIDVVANKILKVKVDDSQLTALNKHLDIKEQHIDRLQSKWNSNPLTVKVDTTQLLQAVGVLKQLDSYRTQSGIDVRVRVQHTIDGSSFADKFEKAGDRVADKIADKVGKVRLKSEGGGLLGMALSPFQSIGQGILNGTGMAAGMRLGEGLAKSFEQRIGQSLSTVGEKLEKHYGDLAQRVSDKFFRTVGFERGLQDVKSEVLTTTKFIEDAFEDSFDHIGEIVFSTLTGQIDKVADEVKGLVADVGGAGLRVAYTPVRLRNQAMASVGSQQAQNLSQNIQVPQNIQAKSITLYAGGLTGQAGGIENAMFGMPFVKPLMKDSHIEAVANSFLNDFSGATHDALMDVYKVLKQLGLDFPKEILDGFNAAGEPNVEPIVGRIAKMLEMAITKGIDPDAVAIAARAAAYRREYPDTPINIMSHSGGGWNVANAIDYLNRMGVDNVHGVGAMTPFTGLARPLPRNFTPIMGTSDQFYQAFFESMPGLFRTAQGAVTVPNANYGHSLATFFPDQRIQEQLFSALNMPRPGLSEITSQENERGAIGFGRYAAIRGMDDKNVYGSIAKMFGQDAPFSYFLNNQNPLAVLDAIQSIQQQMQKAIKSLKNSPEMKAEAEKYLDLLNTLFQEITDFHATGGAMLPTESLKKASDFFYGLRELRNSIDVEGLSSQNQAFKQTAEYQNSLAQFRFSGQYAKDRGNLIRTVQEMHGQQVEGYSFAQSPDSLKGLRDWFAQLSEPLADFNKQDAEQLISFLDDLEGAIRNFKETGQVNEDIVAKAQKYLGVDRETLMHGSTTDAPLYTPPNYEQVFYNSKTIEDFLQHAGALDPYAAKSDQEGFTSTAHANPLSFAAEIPALDLSSVIQEVNKTATEKVAETVAGIADKVGQGLEVIAPVGEAAANALQDVAQGLTNIANNRLQSRVEDLRGQNTNPALPGTGELAKTGESSPATFTELGQIAAQDIEATRKAMLGATEAVIKFADGTIKAGKAARDFIAGLRSEGHKIVDLGDAVVEVSAELVDEFEGLGLGAREVKALTASMQELKGTVDSLPPLLPSAELNESKKKTNELVQAAYNLYEVWDKFSKQSQTISLAQGKNADIKTLREILQIVEQLETALAKARHVEGFTYDQGYEGLISQLRSVQQPLGRMKSGAYRGILANLDQTQEAAKAGDDTAAGFINALQDALPRIEAIANESGKTLIRSIKQSLGIASPSKVMIQVGKDVVAGFEIGLQDLAKVDDLVNNALKNITDPSVDRTKIADSIRGELQNSAQRILVDQSGAVNQFAKVGYESGVATKEGIDKAIPIVREAVSSLTDSIINQLRFIAPGITGFIEGVGLDLDKLKSLGSAGLTLAAGAVAIGLWGDNVVRVFNATADAATEQDRLKRVLEQTVQVGASDYYARVAKQANDLGVNLQTALKSASQLETSLQNTPLAGQGVDLLRGFQSQFAAQGTPIEDQQRALVGLEQAFRKGKLQAEELYQIIEPLPGAMEALQAATGKSATELFRAQQAGELFTQDIAQSWSRQLELMSGLSGRADTAEASMGRLQNQVYTLSGNFGKLTNAVRKGGTDLFGGALEVANSNSELLNAALAALAVTAGVALVRALGAAIIQVAGFVQGTQLGAAAAVTFNAALSSMMPTLLTVGGLIAAVSAVKFAYDLTQPTEEIGKLAEQAEKLKRNLDKLKEEKNPVSQQSLTPQSYLQSIGDFFSGKQVTDIYNNTKSDAQQSNSVQSLKEQLKTAKDLNAEAKGFLDTLEKDAPQLERIRNLSVEIARLQAELAIANSKGDSPKAVELTRQLSEKQAELNKQKDASKLESFKAQLQRQIQLYTAQIAAAKASSAYNPDALKQAAAFEDARANSQELFNKLYGISQLKFTNLQEINTNLSSALLSNQRQLDAFNRQAASAEAQLYKQFGGTGANDQQALSQNIAKLQVTKLQAAGIKLQGDLEQLNKAIKGVNPDTLTDLATMLSSMGTSIDAANNTQLDEALKRLESGGRPPSETLKSYVEGTLKRKNDTVDQINQNAVELAQAQSNVQKAILDTGNAHIDYLRSIEDGQYQIAKAIRDNDRNLKRQLEDTLDQIESTKNEIRQLQFSNSIRSKIQTVSGDFSDSVLSSVESFFNTISEITKERLGIKTNDKTLLRKIEDVRLGQIDFTYGLGMQQRGLADTQANYAGVVKGSFKERDLANLALTALQESSGAQNQLDVAVSMFNRLASGKYGKSLTDIAFAPGQYEPNFGKTPVNTLAEAAARLGAGSQKEIDALLKNLANPAAVQASQRFLGGATDFRGQTQLSNMRSGDPYRGNSGANFFLQESQSNAVAQKALGLLLQKVESVAIGTATGSKPSFVFPLDHLPPGYRLPDQGETNIYGAEGRERTFTTPFAEALAAAMQKAGFSASTLKPENFNSYAQYDQAIKSAASQGTNIVAIHTLFDQYLGRSNFIRIGAGDQGDAALGGKLKTALGTLGGTFGGFDTEKNQTVGLSGSTPGALVELGIISQLEKKFTPEQAARLFASALINQYGGSLKASTASNVLKVPSLPPLGKGGDGVLPAPPTPSAGGTTVVGSSPYEAPLVDALQSTGPLQTQLSNLRIDKLSLDAQKQLRDLINQATQLQASLRQQTISAQGEALQRPLAQLPQTPTIQAISSVTGKQVADTAKIDELKQKISDSTRDLGKLKEEIDDFSKRPVPLENKKQWNDTIQALRITYVEMSNTKAKNEELLKSIEDTSPLKTFTRDLRIATDQQVAQGDSLLSQLDQLKQAANPFDSTNLAQSMHGVERQFASAREQLTQFNESTDASIAELERLAKAAKGFGSTKMAEQLYRSADALRVTAKDIRDAADQSLSPAAEAIAKANLRLDAMLKKTQEARKPFDEARDARLGVLDQQAQLKDALGDQFGAAAIRRRIDAEKTRADIVDKILMKEEEIAKLRNIQSQEKPLSREFGTGSMPDVSALTNSDQLESIKGSAIQVADDIRAAFSGDLFNTEAMDKFQSSLNSVDTNQAIAANEDYINSLRQSQKLSEQLSRQTNPDLADSFKKELGSAIEGLGSDFYGIIKGTQTLQAALVNLLDQLGQFAANLLFKQLSSLLLGGLFPGSGGGSGLGTGAFFAFAGGPVVGNMAAGGPIELGIAASKALAREKQMNGGHKVGLYALTDGEYVLDRKEAAYYRALKANGVIDDVYEAWAGNRADGGSIGTDHATSIKGKANIKPEFSMNNTINVNSEGEAEQMKRLMPALNEHMTRAFSEFMKQQFRPRGSFA